MSTSRSIRCSSVALGCDSDERIRRRVFIAGHRMREQAQQCAAIMVLGSGREFVEQPPQDLKVDRFRESDEDPVDFAGKSGLGFVEKLLVQLLARTQTS